MEGMQRRAIKLILALKNKPYCERFGNASLFSLSHWMSRGDLIEVYKILDKTNVDLEPLIDLSQTGIRLQTFLKKSSRQLERSSVGGLLSGCIQTFTWQAPAKWPWNWSHSPNLQHGKLTECAVTVEGFLVNILVTATKKVFRLKSKHFKPVLNWS